MAVSEPLTVNLTHKSYADKTVAQKIVKVVCCGTDRSRGEDRRPRQVQQQNSNETDLSTSAEVAQQYRRQQYQQQRQQQQQEHQTLQIQSSNEQSCSTGGSSSSCSTSNISSNSSQKLFDSIDLQETHTSADSSGSISDASLAEHRQAGRVTLSTYAFYLRGIGCLLVATVVASLVLMQVVSHLSFLLCCMTASIHDPTA